MNQLNIINLAAAVYESTANVTTLASAEVFVILLKFTFIELFKAPYTYLILWPAILFMLLCGAILSYYMGKIASKL